MNLMVLRHGSDCVILDAGMMFPGADHHGIDVIIPDLSFLENCGTIHGLVLTHAHEDHVGCVPWLVDRHPVAVHGSPYTLALVGQRLKERGIDADLHTFDPGGDRFKVGPFEVETLPVAHSIPQTSMLAVRTPVGMVVHTADFKLDPDPLDGVGVNFQRLKELGDEGVLVLLSDSTNADRPGFTPGERTVGPGLRKAIAGARGRVLVTTFASNVHRIRQIAEAARYHQRQVALIGASMQNQAEIAERLGLLNFPAGHRISTDRVMNQRADRVLVIATGSQGEPMSALARMALDRHRDIKLQEGDRVIHSARIIPGNEKSINRMINHLMRRGAEVVTAADAHVHVSGHPSSEELLLLLNLLRPRHLLPVHGEFRQLTSHARLAADAGMAPDNIVIADSGDVIVVSENEFAVRDHVHVGHVFIDATLEQVEHSVLRDRRRIAGDGVVVPVVPVDRDSGTLGTPELIACGFVTDDDERGLLEDARRIVVESLEDATAEERGDDGVLKTRVQTELKRYLKKRVSRRPLIIPVIVES